MTSREYLKLELMVYAIKSDYFGYGSICEKRKDGRWISIVDGEKTVYSSSQLAAEWDMLYESDRKDILRFFIKDELKININI